MLESKFEASRVCTWLQDLYVFFSYSSSVFQIADYLNLKWPFSKSAKYSRLKMLHWEWKWAFDLDEYGNINKSKMFSLQHSS